MGRKLFDCGIDAAVDVISGKWKVLILWALSDGPRRFGELKRALPSVSEKMLTEHLRQLELDDIVERRAHPEVPPRVEYSLTETGIALNTALVPLGVWGREHKARIEAVRGADSSGDSMASTHS
ncbi:winged helix-turn-helix transcriptional regulator [Actinoalloteichus hymeniacidonis]|uniref:Transcriptional regulator, HxlR family n=1 Tax=Actinoalloteichus hymeniacidonis TaxID=340345 RepID=A0AAC9HVQ3_9PSEU|nr:helix-turn-helix domain-containing protein [Actinoalloteichus hymeniacidonis]AOS65886.1 transcriptional regulator, HxlR family [Actinoalloteichus hymeniacidonis]MBB5906019.1 DNA-binding HxlR family transcriptional regulator [Actinoalloteichus hymeniacidonis]